MSELSGDRALNNPNINEAVQAAISALAEESNKLGRAVKGPDESLVDSSKNIMDEIGKNRGRPLFVPFVGSGIGHGPYVELIDGSVKLDLINGIGIHILGHSNPIVVEAAMRASLSDVVMQGNLEPNREYTQLHKKLVEIASRHSRLRHVWLSTCGTMANENALKACRQKTESRLIIAMDAAFAGRSTMMAEITDNPSFKQGLPDYNEVLRVPFYDKNDPKSSEKALQVLKEHAEKHKDNICCFTFEPMQGEGGYNVAPRDYFLPMLEFCRENKIPVWADEVQTFMRTGEFFAYETLGFGDYVDVVTVAKTLQTGATFFTEEFNPKPGLISGTFSGSSVSLAAGLAIIEHLDKNGYMGPGGKIKGVHNKFVAMLNKLNETSCKGLLQDAAGLGLMVAVTPLDGSREKMLSLVHTLFKNGILSFGCGKGPYKLRFLLPAILTDQDIESAGKIIEKSILELA